MEIARSAAEAEAEAHLVRRPFRSMSAGALVDKMMVSWDASVRALGDIRVSFGLRDVSL